MEILSSPAKTDEDGELLIFKFTNWDKPQLINLIKRFTRNNAIDITILVQLLADNRVLVGRIIDAFNTIRETGISAADLILWTSSSPETATLSSLQNTIRAKYDDVDWLALIQPINDKMRKRQRDALVSYILNVLQQDTQTEHIDTPDKLFEFFLIDVEMNPCMKTSRIKQAISTVQLFIYRCLMNLEDGVEPSSINANQWEWMKRYRVWEANRKVFLYPENWLEPSLRDTKSSIFGEFEGELLQSDINDDLATSALLNYLEKLDKIAQMEICGMCREDEYRIHVVGRTSDGANREYYHRRYDGTWSAWKKINLDIEDGPVIPVFWKERLFLFWTSLVQKGQDKDQLSSDQGEGNMIAFNKPVKQKIEVNLCWSEYYNNKWQGKRTSDYDNPDIFETQSSYKLKKQLFLKSLIEEEKLTVFVTLWGKKYRRKFIFFNKHSLPALEPPRILAEKGEVLEVDIDSTELEISEFESKNVVSEYQEQVNLDEFVSLKQKRILSNSPNLSAWYDAGSWRKDEILGNSFYRTIDFHHPITDIFQEPFFCCDHRHVFFVELLESTIKVPKYKGFEPKVVLKRSGYFNFEGAQIGI